MVVEAARAPDRTVHDLEGVGVALLDARAHIAVGDEVFEAVVLLVVT